MTYQQLQDEILQVLQGYLEQEQLSKLKDEDELQEKLCVYLNNRYYETLREVEIPVLKKINGENKDYWRIDESTMRSIANYIPMELKLHGTKLEDRNFVGEVNNDIERVIAIVSHFVDVYVGVVMFITIDKNEQNAKFVNLPTIKIKKQIKEDVAMYVNVWLIGKEGALECLRDENVANKSYRFYYNKKRS